MKSVEDIKKVLSSQINESRYEHILKVIDHSLRLNDKLKLDLDRDKVIYAALLHDSCKHLEDEYFEKYKEKYKLDRSLYSESYNLHSILAGIRAREDFAIADDEIIQAIVSHTKGNTHMTKLDKLIYIADATEPDRSYPGLESIRKAIEKNLNLGVLTYMVNNIKYLSESKKEISQDTYEVLDSIRRDIMTEKLDIVLKACEDKLAENIKTIEIGEKSPIADYFVIATGGSLPQMKAIVEEIESKVEEAGYEIISKEGLREGGWILIDLGDIIVHVFTEDQRDFYSLENLWD